MAMQVKHMLTVGLGLGVATAFGYHFLSSPQQAASTESATQLMPLNHFSLDPTPSAIGELPTIGISPAIGESPAVEGPSAFNGPPAFEKPAMPPIPAQPPVDNQFRSEATPLRSSNSEQPDVIGPNANYQDLVAAAQATLPATDPVATQPLSSEPEDSDDSFSLDLNSYENDKAPEFVFEDQSELQPPSTLELEPSFDETSQEIVEATEFAGQDVSQTVTDQQPFAGIPAQDIASQDQEQIFPVVVDYNSNVIGRPAAKQNKPKTNTWKTNPFINSEPAASVETAETIVAQSDLPPEASILELPAPSELAAPVTIEQAPQTGIQTAAMPQVTSVLSLNDPANENLVRTMPATTIPHAIPQQQPRLVNDQLAGHTTQLTPSGRPAMNSADTLKAVHHIEYGKTLSRRGAAYTARQEFLAALQLIATANDRISGDNRHSKALRSAMLTIKEAGDFSVENSEQQIQMDVASVVEAHRSNVLTPAQAAKLSSVQAMNRYFAKAQEQLDLAGGRNVVSAEVFYCIGKLHTVLSRNQKVLGPYETAKSVVYHQVALLSDNQHHRSANELGVLLARSGRLEQAKLLFERSLMTQPTVRTWQNLAEAHRRLGETDFANRAASEVQMMASAQPTIHSNIQWKPVDQFNADAPVEFNEQRVAQLPPAPTQSKPAPAGKPSPAKSIADRIKGIF